MWSESEEIPVPTSKLYEERKAEWGSIVTQGFLSEGCSLEKVKQALADGNIIAEPLFFDWEDGWGPCGSKGLKDGFLMSALMPDAWWKVLLDRLGCLLPSCLQAPKGEDRMIEEIARSSGLERAGWSICSGWRTELLEPAEVPDEEKVELCTDAMAGIYRRWRELAEAFSPFIGQMRQLEVYTRIELSDSEIQLITDQLVWRARADNWECLEDLSENDWQNLSAILVPFLTSLIKEYKTKIWPHLITPDTLVAKTDAKEVAID